MSMCKCVFMSVCMPVEVCHMHPWMQMCLENTFTMQSSIRVHVFIFAHVHGFQCVQGCVQVCVHFCLPCWVFTCDIHVHMLAWMSVHAGLYEITLTAALQGHMEGPGALRTVGQH